MHETQKTAKPTPYTWVLLRGLARQAEHWGHFRDRFHARWAGQEVLSIDLPGSGEFRQIQSPANIPEIASFVRAKAVERAKSQSLFKVVAVSLGGMVALEWMKARPEDFKSCVLINTSAKNLSPVTERLRPSVWLKLLKVLTTQSAKERERQIIAMLMNNPEARENALPLWARLGAEAPISYRNFASQLYAAARYQGVERPPHVPVLILNGLGDRFVDPSCSTALHEKFHWPIERHAWAGHDLPWDDPQWVIDKIAAWDKTL